jgi:C1A family cysteine protease
MKNYLLKIPTAFRQLGHPLKILSTLLLFFFCLPLMQGQVTTYKVILDACHGKIDHEGTGNKITVDFYAGNIKVKSQSKNDIKPCVGEGAEFSIRTSENISRFIVSTNGEDGFYIDEAYIYANGNLIKRFGGDGGKGWCMSTDPNDANGSWKGYITDNKCHRRLEFKFGVAPTSESGFRVLVNGMHCTKTANFSGSDEVWVEFYIDGASSPQKKSERLSMNNNSKKYQSRFGSVYAENSVRLKVYNQNGFMGELTVNKNDADNNYINRPLTGSGEYDITISKITRENSNPKYVGVSSSIKLRIPVLDQGSEGACVAFAVVAALTHVYYQTIDRNGKQKTELFDPRAFYRRRSNNSEDWHINKALNKLILEGIPFKSDPNKRLYLKGYYKLTNSGTQIYYTKKGTSIVKNNPHQSTFRNGDLMRNALQRGSPLLANYKVYEDFDFVDMSATKSNNSVYGGGASRNFLGNHAVVVTGYSTPNWKSHSVSYWLLQNSWGAHSGVNGSYMFAEGACNFDDVMYKLGGFEVVNSNTTNTYKVVLDACHNKIEHEGTKNRITVDFYAGSKKVTSQSKNGVAPCVGSGAEYSIKTTEKITRVVVSTNGDDGFFIDEAYLYINNSLARKFDKDDGQGWCLSTDPTDASRSWKGYAKDNRCYSQVEFKY